MELPLMINDLADLTYWLWIITAFYTVALFGYEIVWQRIVLKKWPKPIFLCTMIYIACSGWDKYKQLVARTLRECNKMDEYMVLMSSWQWAARTWIARIALWWMLYILTKRLSNGGNNG
jgi:hypothetical protein